MTAGRRLAGDVYVVNSATQAIPTNNRLTQVIRTSTSVTTSATVVLLSANTTGATCFAITNRGSTTGYVVGSFDTTFFPTAQIAVTNPSLVSTVVKVSAIPASANVTFDGPYEVIRVIASGSGVYQMELVAYSK